MKYGKCHYPYKHSLLNKTIRIFATGPSLNDEIKWLRENRTLNDEPVFVMNFFALSSLFIELRPTRYCLADRVFFGEGIRVEKVQELIGVLNTKVSWQMTLYVPEVNFKRAKEIFINNYISIIPISTQHFEGFELTRNFFYKKGIATPSFVNVLIMVEYICLNEGFSKLLLYGVDHTFLKNLIVDDDNVLKVEDTHFYGTEKLIADIHEDGTPWSVAEFVYDKYLTFKEHQVMRLYSDYLGAVIINCTKCSWIDAYLRLTEVK